METRLTMSVRQSGRRQLLEPLLEIVDQMRMNSCRFFVLNHRYSV